VSGRDGRSHWRVLPTGNVRDHRRPRAPPGTFAGHWARAKDNQTEDRHHAARTRPSRTSGGLGRPADAHRPTAT